MYFTLPWRTTCIVKSLLSASALSGVELYDDCGSSSLVTKAALHYASSSQNQCGSDQLRPGKVHCANFIITHKNMSKSILGKSVSRGVKSNRCLDPIGPPTQFYTYL